MTERCKEIKDNGVIVEGKDGQEQFLEADHILLRPVAIAKDLRNLSWDHCETAMIGDCDRVAKYWKRQ
jgi:hypothetical protein